MHLHVQRLGNEAGLLPHSHIMCPLRNNYQSECYKMGQQFYSTLCGILATKHNKLSSVLFTSIRKLH